MVLVTACLALFVSTLDNSVANVALPSIGRSLHAGSSGLSWVVDGYVVVRGCLLMSAGALGDRYGRRRMFRLGLSVFGVGSLLCSLAPRTDLLIAARVLQAVGGSVLVPSSLALVVGAYPREKERARAIGIWSAVTAVSTGLGPPLGGLLISVAGWRSVFWINLPIVAVALVLAARYTQESTEASRRRLDPGGQLLIGVVVLAAISALIEAADRGWTSPVVLSLFAVALLATVGFVSTERRSTDPLLDPSLFANPAFSGAAAVAVTAFVIYAGFLFVNTLYLQDIRGYSALVAGVVVVPTTLGNLVLSPLSGRMTAARGPRRPVVLAAVSMSVGAGLLATYVHRGPLWVLVIGYVLIGSGVGLVNTPITNAAVASLPPDRAGVAGALTSMFRQLGNAIGVALFGTLSLSGLSRVARRTFVGGGELAPSAIDRFLAGLQHAYVVAAGFGVLTLIIALATFGKTPEGFPPVGPEHIAA